MNRFIARVLSLAAVFGALTVFSAPQSVRWTGSEDKNPELAHVLDVVKAKTGLQLSPTDFMLLEDKDLAHTHFLMLVETAGKVPMRGMSLRIWTSLADGTAVQVEAKLDAPPSHDAMRALMANSSPLDSGTTMAMVRKVVASHLDDNKMGETTWKDYWDNGALVREVKVKGRHGVHTIVLSIQEQRLLSAKYEEYPQADAADGTPAGGDEFNIPVKIYTVYEEVEDTHEMLPRTDSELRYIQARVARPTEDPYGALRTQRYLDDKQDPVLGITADGRSQGYWSMNLIKEMAFQIFSALPKSDNTFGNPNGVVLEGRYATVNLNPDALGAFHGLDFAPPRSAVFKPDWKNRPENANAQEMIPSGTYHGRPLMSAAEALNRPAERLPNHDPVKYMNDGFDELQVYWAVNQMFDSLRSMGFTDPELSTRRFNAFLYDPDISYRDNAFYTDDTINFTTYSPSEPNMARDNTTIWHELGHGVMDRLMGDSIVLADTGGLSEGMADFCAQMVLNDVTGGQTFPGKEKMRIFNNTAFNMTNEVHDDGEAYGGTMNDILVAAMQKEGHTGLVKVTDLTLETMRLTRDNPGLTANDWFSHMLFADELGNSPVREPGELKSLILGALAGRNFNLDGSPVATYTLKNGDQEVVAGALGSRDNPIPVKLKPADTSTYHLSVALKGTPTYQFKYPVTVKVGLTGGALQGGIHWQGKEHEPFIYQLKSEADVVKFDVTATGKCDLVNRPDGSCVDFAYVQIFNAGQTGKPSAKKRFYLRLYPQKG